MQIDNDKIKFLFGSKKIKERNSFPFNNISKEFLTSLSKEIFAEKNQKNLMMLLL